MAFPWEVVALAVVLGINRLALPAAIKRPPLFWAIQAMDVAVIVAVLFFGMPGLKHVPAVAWMVAAIVAFHVVQNLSVRSKAVHDERRKAEERELVRLAREAAEIDAAADARQAQPDTRGDAENELGVPGRGPR